MRSPVWLFEGTCNYPSTTKQDEVIFVEYLARIFNTVISNKMNG